MTAIGVSDVLVIDSGFGHLLFYDFLAGGVHQVVSAAVKNQYLNAGIFQQTSLVIYGELYLPGFQGIAVAFVHGHLMEHFRHRIGIVIPPFDIIPGHTFKGGAVGIIDIIRVIGIFGIGTDHSGGFQNELIHFFRIIHGKGLSIETAHGVPHDAGFFQTDFIHEAGDVPSKYGIVIFLHIGFVGIAVTSLVRNIKMVIVDQIGNQQGPGTAGIGHSMEQDQRLPVGVAHFDIGHGDAAVEFYIFFEIVPITLGNGGG